MVRVHESFFKPGNHVFSLYYVCVSVCVCVKMGHLVVIRFLP